MPIFEDDARYLDVLEHIAEPERVVMFRVPWTNDEGKIVSSSVFIPAYHADG